MTANIVVELPYQVFISIFMWTGWYWAVFGKNQSGEQRGLMLLLVVQFMIFVSTFAHMVIAALPDAETAGNIATLLFTMMLTFNGVMQAPSALPGFWIFMCKLLDCALHMGLFTDMLARSCITNDLPRSCLGRYWSDGPSN